MALIIADSHVERMLDHASFGYPEEVCGLLLGRCVGAQDRRIAAVRPAVNVNRGRARDRYELDPTAYLAAESESKELGWEILGVYHTHPDHPPVPSETDRLRAVDLWRDSESWSYVILEVAGGRVVSWRTWVLRAGQFHEERAEVVPAATV